MFKINLAIITSGLVAITLATSAIAQQSQEDFPRQRTAQNTCQDVNWNANMKQRHPRLIEACQEVVDVDGESWARFHAKFEEIESDGTVVFSVQDRRQRSVEKMRLVPKENQVAYIDGRATPFNQLPDSQLISLYVPEGEYGFATQAGGSRNELASVSPGSGSDRQSSRRQASRPSVLPETASSFNWILLTGMFSLLGGLILTMRRLR